MARRVWSIGAMVAADAARVRRMGRPRCARVLSGGNGAGPDSDPGPGRAPLLPRPPDFPPLPPAPRRPGGRLRLGEDYGRDDTTHLCADADREARLADASDRRGAMLAAGFKVRVLHCWWTFADIDAVAATLATLFPATGAAFSAGLPRPRVSPQGAGSPP